MVSKDLTFRLFGEDVNASASLRKLSREAETSGKGIHKAFGNAPRDVTAIAAAAGAASVYMAASFQTATTRLVTDAGESKSNLAKVQAGILSISDQTGETSAEIAKGMYLVESAGYHGAGGLKVMAAAAEGAKIGGADLSTVSDALTTAMTDYHEPASKAADVTSQLIATVSNGKTNMEALAGSLHSVLPGAEAAHLGIDQVLGAMATMTAEGVSADQAAENLNHAILSLQNPTQVQTKAMAAMGLSSHEVAKNLGKKGLTGTYEELTSAIAQHIKGGDVVIDSFNRSKQAAASAQAELKALPQSVRGLAQSYLDGKISLGDWTKQVKAQAGPNANLLKQFASTANAAHGFSDAVKSGQGPFSTYAAQLSKMTGGQTGLQVALHVTGEHAETLTHNVKAVGAAHAEAGGHVHDWATIQKTFNQQLAEAGTTFENIGIRVGTKLLPGLTAAAKTFGGFLKDLVAGRAGAVAIAAAVGVFVAAMVGLYTATKVYEGAAAAARITLFLLGGAQKAAALATGLHSGALYANITATIRSKAESAALYAMYAREAVATKAKAVAAWVQTTAAASVNAAKTGAVWVAQAAKAGATWVAMKAKAIASFVATAASAIANGARMAAVWVAQKAAVAGYIVVQGLLKAATVAGTAAQWLLNAAMDANPIGIVVIAVAALAAGLVWFFTQTKVGQQVWAAFCAGLQAAWNGIVSFFQATIANVVGFFVKFGPLILTAVAPMLGLPLLIISHWGQIVAFFEQLGPKVVGFLAGAGQWLVDTGSKILSGLLSGAQEGLAALGRWELKIGAAVIGWLAGAAGWLVSVGASILHGLASGAQTGFKAVSTFVSGIKGKVLGFLAGAGSWLTGIGGSILNGLIGGLQGAVGHVKDFFVGLTKAIPSWKGPAETDRTLLTPAGHMIIGSLVDGLNQKRGDVKAALGRQTAEISATTKKYFDEATPKVFRTVRDFVQNGLVTGLDGKQAAVKSAMGSLTTKVTDAFDHLADSRAAVQKRLKQLDVELGNTDEATKSGRKRAAVLRAEIAAEKTVASQLKNASKIGRSALLSDLKADTDGLTKLAAQRDALGKQLTAAQKTLTEATKQRTDFADSVSSDAVAGGNIAQGFSTKAQQKIADAATKASDLQTQIADLDNSVDSAADDRDAVVQKIANEQTRLAAATTAASQAAAQNQIATLTAQLSSIDNTVATYQNRRANLAGKMQAAQATATADPVSVLMSTLQDQVTHTQQFGAVLAQLKSEGLDDGSYRQLVKDGVDGGGLDAANALQAAGPDTVAQITALQGQLKTASDALGAQTASDLYDAGVQSAQGAVDGLQSQITVVSGAMGAVEKGLATSVAGLGINTSALTKQAGSDIGDALTQGLASKQDALDEVLGTMSDSITSTIEKALHFKPKKALAGLTITAPGGDLATVATKGGSGSKAAKPAKTKTKTAGAPKSALTVKHMHVTPKQSPAEIASNLAWQMRSGV